MRKNRFRIILTLVFIFLAIWYLKPTYDDYKFNQESKQLKTLEDSIAFENKYGNDVLKAKEKKEEKTNEGTNGLGQVQYFVHPNSEESMGAIEMNELDKIQKQIQESGMKYNQVTGVEVDLLSGEEDLNGSEMGEVDPSEKNY